MRAEVESWAGDERILCLLIPKFLARREGHSGARESLKICPYPPPEKYYVSSGVAGSVLWTASSEVMGGGYLRGICLAWFGEMVWQGRRSG